MSNLIKKNLSFLLNETPDHTIGSSNDTQINLSWNNSFAVPFGYFNNNIIVFGTNIRNIQTHSDIFFELKNAVKLSSGNITLFKQIIKDIIILPNITEEFISFIKEYKLKNNDFKSLRIDFFKYSGRIWPSYNVIAFWNNVIDTNSLKTIVNYLKEYYPININLLRIDNMIKDIKSKNYNDLPLYTSILNTEEIQNKLTNKEKTEILKKAHIRPWELNNREKEFIKQIRGDMKNINSVSQERAKKFGFDTVAEYKYWLSKLRERGLSSYSFQEYAFNNNKKKKKKINKNKIDKLDQDDQSYITYKNPPLYFPSVNQPAGGVYSGTGM